MIGGRWAVTVLSALVFSACGGGSAEAPAATATTPAPETVAPNTTAAAHAGTVDGGCRADQVDLNAATVEELQRIVHIHRAAAGWIVEGRPWGEIEHLRHLGGMDDARLADIIAQDVACIGEWKTR